MNVVMTDYVFHVAPWMPMILRTRIEKKKGGFSSNLDTKKEQTATSTKPTTPIAHDVFVVADIILGLR